MRHRTEVKQGDAGIECEFNGNIVSSACVFRRYGWSDPGCVWNFVGIGRPSARLLPDGLAWNVARSDDHRKYKLVGAVFVFECLQVADGDGDLLAGHNVGHRLRKDVRALLVE